MKLATTVLSIMTKDIISIKDTNAIKKAIELMVKNDIGSVVITRDGKPVGILTERDIMKKVCPKNLCTMDIGVGEIMSKPLITINKDARLGEAVALMMEKDVRRLLVEDEGKIIGIITQKDLLRGTLETFMALAAV